MCFQITPRETHTLLAAGAAGAAVASLVCFSMTPPQRHTHFDEREVASGQWQVEPSVWQDQAM